MKALYMFTQHLVWYVIQKNFINIQKHCSHGLCHSIYLDYRKTLYKLRDLRAFSQVNDNAATFILALQIFRLDPLLYVRGVRPPVTLVCIVLPNVAHLII